MIRIIITLIVIMNFSIASSDSHHYETVYPSFSNVIFETNPMGCFIDDHFVNPLAIVNIDSSLYICLPIGQNDNGDMLFFLELYYARDISYLDTFDIFLD